MQSVPGTMACEMGQADARRFHEVRASRPCKSQFPLLIHFRHPNGNRYGYRA